MLGDADNDQDVSGTPLGDITAASDHTNHLVTSDLSVPDDHQRSCEDTTEGCRQAPSFDSEDHQLPAGDVKDLWLQVVLPQL